MKGKINGLNDRNLEILDILGFDETKISLSTFLEKCLRNVNIFELHNQGIPLRSLIVILKTELHNQGIPLRSLSVVLP